jgi:DNA-binding Lrp family transcriptional regulator
MKTAIKKTDLKLLFEFVKNCKRSDREIAKIVGVSQPTITRKRAKLVETGLIRQFTAVPSLDKIGYEIAALTFTNMRTSTNENPKSLRNKERDWDEKHDEIVFASVGLGMGMDKVIVSVHKNYTDYQKFLTELRTYWAENIENIHSFILSLRNRETVTKDFSFASLEKTAKVS